jgi:hypothetical protein
LTSMGKLLSFLNLIGKINLSLGIVIYASLVIDGTAFLLSFLAICILFVNKQFTAFLLLSHTSS